MAEYIDKAKAVCAINAKADWGTPIAFRLVLSSAAMTISSLPAADVAPVVRCKDCCHSYADLGGLTCSYGPCVDCVVPEDFYCKHGVRIVNNERDS